MAFNPFSSAEKVAKSAVKKIIDPATRDLRKLVSNLEGSVKKEVNSAKKTVEKTVSNVFTGSSAGGNGVKYNADRIHERLQNSNEDVTVDFRAVVDAAYGRSYPTRDYRNTPMCKLLGHCSYPVLMSNTWYNTKEALYDADPTVPGVSVENDCEANEVGSEWRCADNIHVLENHIATQLFVRQDLQDSLLAGKYEETGFGSFGDFGEIKAYELERFHAADASRGVFGPQCARHTALANNQGFFDETVDVGGTPFNFHDLLSNWVTGAGTTVAIAEFQGPGPAPNCP